MHAVCDACHLQVVEPSRPQLLRGARAAARQGAWHQPHSSNAGHLRGIGGAARGSFVCAVQSVQALGFLGNDRPSAHHHRLARVPPPQSSWEYNILVLLCYRPECHRAHVPLSAAKYTSVLQLTLERCRYYVAYKERLVAGSHNSRAPQMHTEL